MIQANGRWLQNFFPPASAQEVCLRRSSEQWKVTCRGGRNCGILSSCFPLSGGTIPLFRLTQTHGTSPHWFVERPVGPTWVHVLSMELTMVTWMAPPVCSETWSSKGPFSTSMLVPGSVSVREQEFGHISIWIFVSARSRLKDCFGHWTSTIGETPGLTGDGLAA